MEKKNSIRREYTRQNGTVRSTADMRDMFGQIQESETAAMSTFVLHGAVHGRFSGLRSETGKYEYVLLFTVPLIGIITSSYASA